jgi:hypothetical protein
MGSTRAVLGCNELYCNAFHLAFMTVPNSANRFSMTVIASHACKHILNKLLLKNVNCKFANTINDNLTRDILLIFCLVRCYLHVVPLFGTPLPHFTRGLLGIWWSYPMLGSWIHRHVYQFIIQMPQGYRPSSLSHCIRPAQVLILQCYSGNIFGVCLSKVAHVFILAFICRSLSSDA